MTAQNFTYEIKIKHDPAPVHQQAKQGRMLLDGGVALYGTELIEYVFSGVVRTMCTTRMLRQAMREDLNLYRAASGFLYFAKKEESLEDSWVCKPEAFCTRQGLTIRALSQAAPSDYFLLHDAI
jgi:hypothetical protein